MQEAVSGGHLVHRGDQAALGLDREQHHGDAAETEPADREARPAPDVADCLRRRPDHLVDHRDTTARARSAIIGSLCMPASLPARGASSFVWILAPDCVFA